MRKVKAKGCDWGVNVVTTRLWTAGMVGRSRLIIGTCSYLFKMAKMSSRTICNGYVSLLGSVDWPGPDADAPLRARECVALSLRFAMDGEAGAGGRAGGERVPLAAMAMDGWCEALGCWRCARMALDVERGALRAGERGGYRLQQQNPRPVGSWARAVRLEDGAL